MASRTEVEVLELLHVGNCPQPVSGGVHVMCDILAMAQYLIYQPQQ